MFFDAAGTLFETRIGVGEIYSAVAREFGFAVEPNILQKNFARSFRLQPTLAFPAGTPEHKLADLEKEWWRKLVIDVFNGLGPFERFEEFFSEVFERFRGREFWNVFPDAKPALKKLKQRGMRLGVISNFDSRLYDVMRACDLERFFDSIHISSRVGAAKPDPAIFQAALSYHAVDPRMACHVGDSFREDYEGALAAGLSAILLDREDSYAENALANRITTLDQVFNLLD